MKRRPHPVESVSFRRQRQREAHLRVAEAEVVADLRPGRFARAEDELVEELDREQDGDEPGGSAPAPNRALAGRPRQVHARKPILIVWP